MPSLGERRLCVCFFPGVFLTVKVLGFFEHLPSHEPRAFVCLCRSTSCVICCQRTWGVFGFAGSHSTLVAILRVLNVELWSVLRSGEVFL